MPVSTGSAGNGLARATPTAASSLGTACWGPGASGGRDRIGPGAPRGERRASSARRRASLEASATDARWGAVVTESDPAHGLRERRRDGCPWPRRGGGRGAPRARTWPSLAEKVGVGVVQAQVESAASLGAQQGRAKVSTRPMRLNGLEIIPDAGVQVIVETPPPPIPSTERRAAGGGDPRHHPLPRVDPARTRSGKGARAPRPPKWAEGLFKPSARLPAERRHRRAPDQRRGLSVVTSSCRRRRNGARRRRARSRRQPARAGGRPVGPSADGGGARPGDVRRLEVQYRANGGTTVGDCLTPPGRATAPPDEGGGLRARSRRPRPGPRCAARSASATARSGARPSASGCPTRDRALPRRQPHDARRGALAHAHRDQRRRDVRHHPARRRW